MTLSACAPPAEVVVIIPYFQRQGGILGRSLASVFRQRHAPPTRVIIVDDGSPAPVGPELAVLNADEQARVQVIVQSNRGPGPARNMALAAVPDTARYIAFLDSDDVWQDDHLFRATRLLQNGFDLYFADGDFEDMPLSHLQRTHFDPTLHEPVDHDHRLFGFRGDFLAMLLDRTPIVTSTVVIRRETFGTLRFPASRGVCEDLIYWLSIGLRTPRVGFSTLVAATGGRAGVHLSHSVDWRTNKALSAIVGFMDYHRFALRTVPLSDHQRRTVLRHAARCRVDFVITSFAMIRMGKMPDLRLAARYLWLALQSGPDLLRR